MGLKPAPSELSANSHATICSRSLAPSALVTKRATGGCEQVSAGLTGKTLVTAGCQVFDEGRVGYER